MNKFIKHIFQKVCDNIHRSMLRIVISFSVDVMKTITWQIKIRSIIKESFYQVKEWKNFIKYNCLVYFRIEILLFLSDNTSPFPLSCRLLPTDWLYPLLEVDYIFLMIENIVIFIEFNLFLNYFNHLSSLQKNTLWTIRIHWFIDT